MPQYEYYSDIYWHAHKNIPPQGQHQTETRVLDQPDSVRAKPVVQKGSYGPALTGEFTPLPPVRWQRVKV
jgi:hypothetical protein